MKKELQNKIFETKQFIKKPVHEVFDFFSQAKNLEIITPPWLKFNVLHQTTEKIQTGTEFEYKLSLHGIPMRWKSRIEGWILNQEFSDTQIKGPYARWYHTHTFESVEGGTLMKDHVSYRLPLGLVGDIIAGRFVKNDIQKIFSFRARKIEELFR